jgi:peptidoglycan/LPS O-acetylase OafA/YrhL
VLVKHFLVYTTLRIALFVACFAVVSTIAVNVFDNTSTVWIWTIVGAAVLSSVLSLKLLEGPRERLAQSVQRRAERASAAVERARSKEDVD